MAAIDSPKDVDKYVREEIAELLHANDIYEIGSYGWSGPDDVDPDTVGHAMWQVDGPTDELLFRDTGSTALPSVNKWQKLCSVAGADFEGLMIAARLSIGLALFQQRLVGERLDAEDSLTNVHSMAAFMTLGAASDRLRDVFIAAVFEKTARGYADTRERGLFDTPFREAVEHRRDVPKVAEALAMLESLAADNLPFRAARNKIVHRLATELGRMREAAIENIVSAQHDPTAWERLTDADFQAMEAQDEAAMKQKIAETLDRPMQWYRLLVETANEVFVVENGLRNRTK
jgi:hypothetical protein